MEADQDRWPFTPDVAQGIGMLLGALALVIAILYSVMKALFFIAPWIAAFAIFFFLGGKVWEWSRRG